MRQWIRERREHEHREQKHAPAAAPGKTSEVMRHMCLATSVMGPAGCDKCHTAPRCETMNAFSDTHTQLLI